MTTAWKQIAWGMVLLLVDVRIAGWDIVPDALGYLLIALGILSLPATRPLRTIVMLGLLGSSLLALAAQFTPAAPVLQSGLPPVPDANYMLNMTAGALHLVMVYGLFELAKHSVMSVENGTRHVQEAGSLWVIYFTVTSVMLVLAPFAINFSNSDLSALNGILTVIVLILEAVVIYFFFRIAKTLGEG